MEVQKKSQQTNVDSLSEYYLNRRSIKTEEKQHFTIYGIYKTENDSIGVKSRIGGKDIIITIPKTDTLFNEAKFFNKVLSESKVDENNVVNKTFQGWVSKDVTQFGFSKNNLQYNIHLEDNIKTNEIDSVEISRLNLKLSYLNSDLQDSKGWLQEIKEVNIEEEQISMIVEPVDGSEIIWDLELPFQSDISSHPVAQFIETEGYGDPKNLQETGEVFVVHKQNLPTSEHEGYVETLGTDRENEWELISKEQFNSWIDNPVKPSSNVIELTGQVMGLWLVSYLSTKHIIDIMGSNEYGVWPFILLPLILLTTMLCLLGLDILHKTFTYKYNLLSKKYEKFINK